MSSVTVVAIGGHSLLDPALPPTVENQFAVTANAMAPVADLVARGERLVLVHGNGPQVGFMQLRCVLTRDSVHEVPLDTLVANTQGSLGYMIQRSLREALWQRGLYVPVVTVVTEVRVDANDRAFEEPTKPIGRFYTAEEATSLEAAYGWRMIEDSRRGYRRVVPSPSPVEIVQIDVIRSLLTQGAIVVCCGGGGVPVTRGANGQIEGLEAVIDKDRASALLAVKLDAPRLVITTGVEHVYVDYGTEKARALHHTDIAELRELTAQDQFPAGSMRPKIDASVYYLNRIAEGRALICSPGQLVEALDGDGGTHIHHDLSQERARG